jgi:hypothetical protein
MDRPSVASLVATLGNFYLTTWEEYHTSVSVPSAVTVIIQVVWTFNTHNLRSFILVASADRSKEFCSSSPCTSSRLSQVCVFPPHFSRHASKAYATTGISGPSFWDKGILTLTGLSRTDIVQRHHIKDLPLNDLFLVFGAIGLVGNIVARCVLILHVWKLENPDC